MTSQELTSRIIAIRDINSYTSNVTIRARVVNKTDIRTWSNSRGEGKLFSMDLSDNTGKIRMTGFNQSVDTFYNLLKVDDVYYISHFSVKPTNINFYSLDHDHELYFHNDSQILPCTEESSDDIPDAIFHLVSTGDFEHVSPGQTADVDLGVFFLDRIISNGVLTDEILKFLPSIDILNLSLVSTKCVLPCRRFLNRTRSCILRIENRHHLTSVRNWLKESPEIMFNGIYLDVWPVWEWDEEQEQDFETEQDFFEPILSDVFNSLPTLKHLEICFSYYNYLDNKYFNMVTKFILGFVPIESLETLTIDAWVRYESLLVENRNYMNLKDLNAQIFLPAENLPWYLRRFPVLQHWTSRVNATYELPAFIQEKKLFMITQLVLCPTILGEQRITDVENSQMSLRILNVSLEVQNAEYILRIIKANVETLEEVFFRFAMFWRIIKSEIPTLINVKKVYVTPDARDLDDENFDQEGNMKDKILMDPDFISRFPNAILHYTEEVLKFQLGTGD